MATLVITDIPRISSLFETVADGQHDLLVVGEIHRGIEALEQQTPDLIIIQNHLSGLSADILLKHLKSRTKHHAARFALISPSENLAEELSARFESILDPALSDEQLEAAIKQLLSQPAPPPRPAMTPVSSILELPPKADPETSTKTDEDSVLLNPTPAAPAESLTTSMEPVTYDRPRRPNRSIISAFSQHLDTTAEELQPQPAGLTEPHDTVIPHELQPPEFGQPDDSQYTVPPLLQRTGFWLVVATVVLVVIITLVQQRPRSSQQVNLPQSPATQASPNAVSLPAPQTAGDQHQLLSHGLGRPKVLPSFIPQNSVDPGYAKDNPGWESYHGQASEFRAFREKDGTIKALQVIDRSGAGIQDDFYRSILKELAGVTAMRSTSSEVKEGYEIRRGTVAGLELVQYRDAQGGRLRGVVITWP